MVSIPAQFHQGAAGDASHPTASQGPGKGHGHAYGHRRPPSPPPAAPTSPAAPASPASAAVESLTSLIAAQADDDDTMLVLDSEFQETYELYGHPDHFQALLALLDRPVGVGVVRRSRTMTVLKSDGSFAQVQQSEAQYYQRQYTGDELQYLDQLDRLRGRRRARIGEMDFSLAPHKRS